MVGPKTLPWALTLCMTPNVQDLLALELRWTHRELPHPDRLTVHRKGSPGEDDDEPLAHELCCFPNSAQVPSQLVATVCCASEGERLGGVRQRVLLVAWYWCTVSASACRKDC